MKGAFVGSASVHVLLLAVLFLFQPPLARMVRGPDAMQVSMVDPAMLAAATAPAPPPPAEVQKPEPPPEPEAVRIEKPKKAPERRETPPPAPTPPPTAEPAKPQPAAMSYTAIGNAGLGAAVATDGPPFEFAYYLQQIRSRIAAVWAPPAGLVSTGAPIQCVVQFRISRDGRIRGISLENASGVEFFDRAGTRAVQLSDPMPPLPMGYAGSDLGVHFGFEYVAP